MSTLGVLELSIISVQGVLVQETTTFVKVISEYGEIGFLPKHEPFMSSVLPGPIYYRTQDDRHEVFYCSGGMVEVFDHQVRILADECQRAEDLDEKKILEIERKNRAILMAPRSSKDQSFEKAYAELARVAAQLRTLHELKKVNFPKNFE